ncbi:hypothetical protein I546_2727 [Mycobacterium kansasii 732]|nr:hypothetical protein I546_2727 [Mycobacterium kansasii 732]
MDGRPARGDVVGGQRVSRHWLLAPYVEDQSHQRVGSRAAGLATAYKLIEAGHTRWRDVDTPKSLLWSGQAQCSTMC